MKRIAFCFDFDGTVTKQELLPLISKEIKLYEEIQLLTELTLNGHIPFTSSFKLRVKLLSSIPISTVSKIASKVIIDPSIQNFIQENKDNCYIVTGNLNVWIHEVITEYLKCKYYSSIASSSNDYIQNLDLILDKSDAVAKIKQDYDIVVTIGDSMNDCSMFEIADIGVAYGGVHNPVDTLIELSDYVVYDSQSLVNLLNNFKNVY